MYTYRQFTSVSITQSLSSLRIHSFNDRPPCFERSYKRQRVFAGGKNQSCLRKHTKQIRRSGSSIATNESQFPVRNLSSTLLFELTVEARVSKAVKLLRRQWIIPARFSYTPLRNVFSRPIGATETWYESRNVKVFLCKIRPCLFVRAKKNRLTDVWNTALASTTPEMSSTCSVLRALGTTTFVFHLPLPGAPENASINFKSLWSLLTRTVRFYRDCSQNDHCSFKPRSNYKSVTYRNWRRVQWWMIVNLGIFEDHTEPENTQKIKPSALPRVPG